MAMIRLLEMLIAALSALDCLVQAAAGFGRRTGAAMILSRRLLSLHAAAASPEIERGRQPLDGIEVAEHPPSVLA